MPSAPDNLADPASGRVAVLLPLPLAGPYDYAVPKGMALEPGDLVAVPLGGTERLGVVWGAAEGAVAPDRLKPVSARIDCPPLPEALRRFVDWVAAYTLSPQGAVLRMCLSVRAALEPPAPRVAYRLAGPPPQRLTPARRRLIDLLSDGLPRSAPDIAETTGIGAAVLRGLVVAGTVDTVLLPADASYRTPQPDHSSIALSPAQDAVAGRLRADIGAGFSVSLLEGVTGAGKTEVYFEAIAEALRRPGQVLVLLPEIALSAQWLERFEQRFGVAPAVWHSDLRASERRRCWRAVSEAKARVVVGARSALFLPFPDLQLIVVDEEHDASFKQEEGVIYNARDMAVVRARLTGIPVLLASATPSLETLANVEAGRYRHLRLPDRHGAAALPAADLIDLRAAPPPAGRWLSPALVAAVEHALESGEQALLFLNRRGYAPLTLCGACGHRLQCPNCSAWLVEHRLRRRLQCHHCGFACAMPETCPACGVADRLKPCGPGVERLFEEARALFPAARIAVMASDTIGTGDEARALIDQVRRHEIDLIIGTQILAKGHHFPMLTLVGVVDADLGLGGGDLRASERTFQLLTQVAGRAGRAERPGRVLLQTYMPENPVIRAIARGDQAGFVAQEMAARRLAGMPPFGRLGALIVSGPDAMRVSAVARDLAHAAPRTADVQVLGPAPAPLSLLRGRHRYRLLVRTGRDANLQAILNGWLPRVRLPSDVRLQVDIDPQSFL